MGYLGILDPSIKFPLYHGEVQRNGLEFYLLSLSLSLDTWE